eukprot:9221785-Pyramimonas_sp.AAC.1
MGTDSLVIRNRFGYGPRAVQAFGGHRAMWLDEGWGAVQVRLGAVTVFPTWPQSGLCVAPAWFFCLVQCASRVDQRAQE